MAVNRMGKFDHQANQAPAAPSLPPGFQVCPSALMPQPTAWQQEFYRWAYERAQAQVRVPRFHRQLFCVWN